MFPCGSVSKFLLPVADLDPFTGRHSAVNAMDQEQLPQQPECNSVFQNTDVRTQNTENLTSPYPSKRSNFNHQVPPPLLIPSCKAFGNCGKLNSVMTLLPPATARSLYLLDL